jgi:hypothetical protein
LHASRQAHTLNKMNDIQWASLVGHAYLLEVVFGRGFQIFESDFIGIPTKEIK